MYNYIKENRSKILIFPLIAYWSLLFIGTSLPSDHLPLIIDLSDKIKHLLAFLGLGFLLSLNLHFQQKWSKISKYAFFYSLLICIFYGAVDEIHQLLVPNRSAELLDWVADVTGSILGILFAMFFLKKIRTNQFRTET